MPLSPTDPEVALLKRNLSALVRALRAAGITRVAVSFDGARGRCRACAIEVWPPDAARQLPLQRVVLERLAADAGLGPVAALTDESLLGEALRRFTLHWANLEHGHWQRGDGGRGVMRLVVTTREVTLDFDALHIEQHHSRLTD